MVENLICTIFPLLSVVPVDYVHTQLVGTSVLYMLCDVGSSVDSLAASRIPPYLITLFLVQNFMATTIRDIVTILASPSF